MRNVAVAERYLATHIEQARDDMRAHCQINGITNSLRVVSGRGAVKPPNRV
jgi:hypothetical protein